MVVEKEFTFKNYPIPTITLTVDKTMPCGGDKITITADGGTINSKYTWKIDGLIQSGNARTLDYTSVKKQDKPVMEGTYAYIVRVDNDTVLRGTILVVR